MALHTHKSGNLAGAARSQQGVPEPSAEPNVRDLARGLQAGQMSADQLLQLLRVLMSGGGGQRAPMRRNQGNAQVRQIRQMAASNTRSGQGATSPIEQAMRRQGNRG